ncbi:unnamed protein product [Victoria cruziana]
MEVESLRPSGTSGILREAFKVPNKNGRIMCLVTVLTLLPLSLLVLYHNIVLFPYAQRLLSLLPIDDPTSSEAAAEREELLRALRSFSIVEILYASAIGVVSVIALLATVYSAAAIHGGKSLTLRALSWRVATTWNRPLITWLYVVMMVMALILFFLFAFGAAVLMLGEWIPIVAAFVLLSILTSGLFIYFAAIWMLALVASIVEENCYGMEALGKAEMFVKGRKVQGFMLVLATSLCAAVISWLWNLGMNTKLELRITIQIVLVCLFSFVKLWTFTVFTLFYCECKRSHGEKVEMDGLADEEPKYAALSAKV